VSAPAATGAAEELPVHPVEPAHHEAHGEETTRRHDHDKQRLCRQDVEAPERPLAEKFPENAEKAQGKQKTDTHSHPVNKGRQELVFAREHLRPGKDDGKGDDEHDIEAHFLVNRSLVGRHHLIDHGDPRSGDENVGRDTDFRADKVPKQGNRYVRHGHDE
jgi:hypothetical protein